MATALKDASSHFAFGENWASYAGSVTEAQLRQAQSGLEKLVGKRLDGKRFLDIGSGSGVHTVAALKMGAREAMAIDIDARSVQTTRSVLQRFAPGASYRAEQLSVFDLSPDSCGGKFDVTYSWGVLHHTGDLKLALKQAAEMVADDGLLVLAIYRKTWLCPFWKIEKRWYSRAPAGAQRLARRLYEKWFRLIAGRFDDVDAYLANYSSARGMDFQHDVHDWLGGYPYESLLPDDIERLMAKLGFTLEESFLCVPRRNRSHGLLGSACDEYVFRKRATHRSDAINLCDTNTKMADVRPSGIS
jgi:2-polyprenyl-6-hydroxyphenyl methylase/3-demethylubiquinone-9 3-methyltransferase